MYKKTDEENLLKTRLKLYPVSLPHCLQFGIHRFWGLSGFFRLNLCFHFKIDILNGAGFVVRPKYINLEAVGSNLVICLCSTEQLKKIKIHDLHHVQLLLIPRFCVMFTSGLTDNTNLLFRNLRFTRESNSFKGHPALDRASWSMKRV